MNTMLVLTTVFSVAVALAAVIAVFVAFRQDRRRSQARVAALRQATRSAEAFDDIAAAPIELALDDFAVDHADAGDLRAGAARPMFGDAPEPSLWGRRLAAAAATAVVVAATGYVLLPRSHSADAPQAPVAAAVQPLELLSLRHSQEEGRLVITGLVQNPRSGAPLSRVMATVFLFGTDGTFVASGRAPLDFSTLTPGDESPFVVAVPVTAAVARYRVGFRSEDGRVIAHVDRRATGTLARTAE